MSLKIKKKRYYPSEMPCPDCGRRNRWVNSVPILLSLEDEHKRWYRCDCGCRWTTRGIRGV